LIGVVFVYFYFLNQIAWFMPIFTQLIMSLIVVLIGYIHTKRAKYYRETYGDLAYQKYFYRYIIPLLVTWYAVFFHPFFILGRNLLPIWIALILGALFFIMFVLVSIHIEKAGFSVITHGMDLYSIFPEEAPVVRGEIYGYVRHPLYLSLTFGCFALAFIANNYIALILAFIQLIPCIVMGKVEDTELINREGKDHREYIQSTAMLFPFKRILGFLRLLFFFK
jgi:protein-S-isoprenylcysteine O-methyltransferase Ste14